MDRFYTHKDHVFAVSAYKESPYLEECVRSLLAQNKPTSVIICTSTPNEHISSVAKKYDLPLYVRNGTSNIADDWNFAVDCALGMQQKPLVTVAHQDDVYLPKYTTKMLTTINSTQRPLIFFTDYAEIRGKNLVATNKLLMTKRKMLKPLADPKRQTSIAARRRILSMGSAICCPSVTLCLENLQLPVFESGMKSNLDWQAWERISKQPGAFIYEPQVLMHHRIHDDSETSTLIADDTRESEDLLMYKKFWPEPIAKALNGAYASGRESNNLE